MPIWPRRSPERQGSRASAQPRWRRRHGFRRAGPAAGARAAYARRPGGRAAGRRHGIAPGQEDGTGIPTPRRATGGPRVRATTREHITMGGRGHVRWRGNKVADGPRLPEPARSHDRSGCPTPIAQDLPTAGRSITDQASQRTVVPGASRDHARSRRDLVRSTPRRPDHQAPAPVTRDNAPAVPEAAVIGEAPSFPAMLGVIPSTPVPCRGAPFPTRCSTARRSPASRSAVPRCAVMTTAARGLSARTRWASGG